MASAYYHAPPPSHHQPQYSYYAPPPPPGVVPPTPAAPPHHLQPAYGSMYESQPSSRDELRTLFIAGLPDDAKHREIYNLFRDFPGYESCHLRNSGQSSQAFGFAVFSDQQSAVAAMHALNGIVFDLEKDTTTLHIDLAKSNSRSKRSRTEERQSYSSDKKVRRSHVNSQSIVDAGHGSNIHVSGLGKSAHITNGNSSSQSAMDFYPNAAPSFDATKDPLGASVTQSNPPCPTLFVANLGPSCTEHELSQVFSRCPGFLKLKMQNKRGVPVAFIDFQDATCSAGALNSLQGFILRSSEGEGMRLEYAKSRMGLRRRDR